QLQKYNFPGNVRELRNMVERALILSDGQKLIPDDFPIKSTESAARTTTETKLPSRITLNIDEWEKILIEDALRETAGNQIKAGELLGISRDALKHRIKKHGITIQRIIE
nr:hypothetical protein [Bacteroidota bacterium]